MSHARSGKAIIRELEEDGWKVVLTNGGHYKATHPEAPGKPMFISQSPSDARHHHNVRAMARRLRRRSA